MPQLGGFFELIMILWNTLHDLTVFIIAIYFNFITSRALGHVYFSCYYSNEIIFV